MTQPGPPEPTGHPAGQKARHFIHQEIDQDLASGRYQDVHTRFPPEPNGFPHIGHAKAICAVFGLAEEYGGKCNLRFDDTNPSAEEERYVQAIQEDIRWLGFDWEDRLYFASDFFETLYEWAQHLIRTGYAYVDHLSMEAIRAGRGRRDRPQDPGEESPYRNRPADESLADFAKMRAGDYPEGACVLRAKIDMAHTNLLMRDPVLYRIQFAHHHRTGDAWKIYPTYDMAHGQCDALEKITHSLCSLEFANHRPLYEWLLDHLPVQSHPRQIEFARLNITHTVLSKRFLRTLVETGKVDGWDDPRMPTLRGMRRRGFTPASIRNFCQRIGMTRTLSTIDLSWLEEELRKDLNQHADRRMVVLDPLKVVIENLPEGERLECQATNNPEQPNSGTRTLQLTREVWIEQEDFREEANRKFFRLKKDGSVRLRYGYVIHCHDVVKDSEGRVTEVRCTYDPETGGGKTPEGQAKVKGIIHWVSKEQAIPIEVHLIDVLFSDPHPMAGEADDYLHKLNPDSRTVLQGCQAEPSLQEARPGQPFQFERLGYFVLDAPDGQPNADRLVFNRSVSLRDSRPQDGA
ncbi:MAG: glutamine--tRNA ligase/YqeY domain fusion protein [Planctomycetes bacterium]|nr:glutamine--tRNA ligase/YqeY domain fusion protein [Planctomycetota bacterium]MCB9910540.1 glutamine--tRNA ligase/YqeY domain fusion protein [Planctomycetota bacterium]HPF13653.1 glutamine--tRNA ligase/YqeY domain fusion protein [Planctomycetota bacterium]